MTQKISISKILSLFFLTYSLNYCKKDSCCEECCDCLYSVEIEKDPSGKGLLIKKKGKLVVKLETLQDYIDNIVEIIGKCKNTFLCRVSILTEPNNIKGFADMKKKVETIFNDKNNPNFENELSSLENSDIDWKWGKNDTKEGWTDDSSMGLCLADSLIVKNGSFNPQDIMRRFLAWWYCGYNNASMYQKTKSISWGLGGNISDSFENYISNPVDFTTAGGDKGKYISGNGSIMRNAAIPIAYHNDLNLAMENAKKQSKIL